MDQLKADEQLISIAVRYREKWERLSAVASETQKKLTATREEADLFQVEVDEFRQQTEEKRARYDKGTQLRKLAEDVARYRDERREYERQVIQLKHDMSQSFGTTKSLRELAQEKERLDHAIEMKKKELVKIDKEVRR